MQDEGEGLVSRMSLQSLYISGEWLKLPLTAQIERAHFIVHVLRARRAPSRSFLVLLRGRALREHEDDQTCPRFSPFVMR